jgi:hypothetical protein
MDLQVGQGITAPFLSAPAEVKTFGPRAGYYLLEVVLDDDHHTFKPLRITDDQLAQIEILAVSAGELSGWSDTRGRSLPCQCHGNMRGTLGRAESQVYFASVLDTLLKGLCDVDWQCEEPLVPPDEVAPVAYATSPWAWWATSTIGSTWGC